MKKITFDELFDSVKDSEAFDVEQLCFEVSHQLAERLSELAKQSGMSQRSLATVLGVSDAYVSRVLHGHPNLTLATIVKFARALEARVVAPRIVARESGHTATIVLGEAEISRNAPRSWRNLASDVPTDELSRPVATATQAEDCNVPSTAA